MKKVFALILVLAMALSLVACGGGENSNAVDIAVLVPNADHGWTGAVMTYAEEYAKELNDAGKYTVKVITSTDAANQISQIEDLIENKTAKNVVILPQDNTVEASMKKLADSGIPFVMFDRIIDSVSGSAIASVKGDNNGIGAETAKRFIAAGMKPGDKILIMPGDNSSVPGMRNDGFKGVLLENGWTQEQVDAIESTDYTGWSRSKGKELFTAWLDAHTVEEIQECKWIFTHDDEIAMGILEALKSSEIDAEKKAAFYAADVYLGSSSGLNEIYSVLKGIHQKDYAAEVAELADLFSVTYDPAMIKTAIQDMVDHLEGKTVTQDHVIPVAVVDASNVDQYQGFGDAVSK
ncbi:MAG: substrate-binding domain-containing protein [Oscillospiraceae bacterium]|nr:substrate-binding domain-containing protein [Oscillospiraceae bacterium]